MDHSALRINKYRLECQEGEEAAKQIINMSSSIACLRGLCRTLRTRDWSSEWFDIVFTKTNPSQGDRFCCQQSILSRSEADGHWPHPGPGPIRGQYCVCLTNQRTASCWPPVTRHWPWLAPWGLVTGHMRICRSQWELRPGATQHSDQKNNQHFNYFHLILMSPAEHVYDFLKQCLSLQEVSTQ